MSEFLDNRTQRVQTLRHIITGLHQGEDVAAVKARLTDLVRSTTGDEIVEMEQALIQGGMDPQEIAGMCDLHSEVVREVVAQPEAGGVPAGHPVDTFRRENRALRAEVENLRVLHARVVGLPGERVPPGLLGSWREQLEVVAQVEKHYDRKENLLFPILERHGITGPSKVMWAKDDEVRELLRALREALTVDEAGLEEWKVVAESVGEPLVNALVEMIFKEEQILLPMSLETLTAMEWGTIHRESDGIGYCLVQPEPGFTAPAEETASEPDPAEGSAAAAAPEAAPVVQFTTGALNPAQLEAIFLSLPLDLTFVDADDRVAYFTEGDRIFTRTKAIIGRKVQNCHPPSSVHVVERILEDFRSGRQDSAEFWIQFKGRFVFIRYFAVRDDQGAYLGTLEVTQDLTRLRTLEGERRLLSYDEPAA